MNSTRQVSLIFRGFAADCKEIERAFGVAASRAGRQGDLVKSGLPALLKKSFVRFSVELSDDVRLDKVVPIILDYLGGVEAIGKVRDTFKPEFVDLDIVWPVRGDDIIADGYFPVSVMKDLVSLDISLGLSIA